MEHLILPDIRSHDAITPSVAPVLTNIPEGYGNGTVVPAAYGAPAVPYYIANPTGTLTVDDELILNGGVLQVVGGVLELDGVPVGGGGGGAVDSVSAGAGLTVAPTTGAVVVSMPNVGVAGAVNNVANITTDAQGRITSRTSYGFVPQSAADVAAALAPYAPLAGATFTGQVSAPAPIAGSNVINKAYGDTNYAALAGATFTGAVNTAGTTLTVATPTQPAQAATKAYVDAAVSGSGAVASVGAGSNIAITGTATAPVVNIGITESLNMQTEAITNCTSLNAPSGGAVDIVGGDVNIRQLGSAAQTSALNITSALATTITAGGAVEVAAGAHVGMTAVGYATIYATGVGGLSGTVSIGGPINHITVENDGVSITGVGNLSASSNVGANQVIATTSITAPIHQVGNSSNFNSLTQNSGLGYLKTNNSVAPVAGEAGLVDSHYNPAVLSLSNTTLKVSALGGSGSNTLMSSVDLAPIIPAVPAGISQYATINQAPGGTYAVSAGQANSALFFDITATGNLNITLPNGVPNGTMFFIGLAYDSAIGAQLTVFPVGGGIGAGRETVIKGGNAGCLYIANGTVAGNVMYTPTDTGAYLALTGGTLTGALTVEETTNIEAKNITTALLTPLPSVGYISMLGATQVEGGNFLVANPAGSEIGLAASASPAPGEVATISYNYAVDDEVHMNKVLAAPGAVLDGHDVVPLLTFKDARTFYVSKQGADTNDGSANAPFLTVQAAVSAGLATGAEVVIDVAPGVYNENITIASVAGIIIRGVAPSDRCIEGTILSGVISIQCNTTDNLNNNQVVLNGCAILGHIHDTSTKQHTLIIDGCRIEGNAANAGQALLVEMTSTDGRTFVQNCVITQEVGTTGLSAVVSCDVGWLNLLNCEITARAEGSCVHVHGSAYLVRMQSCALSSTSASATPSALLFLNSTSAAAHNVALTSFAYSVATSKTAPAILATRPSAGTITAVVANCAFALAGTLTAGNVIQYGAATALVLLVAGNRSLNTAAAQYASRIQSGATVLPLTQVGESTVNTVNGLSNAITLAAGTNMSLGTVGNTITFNCTAPGTLTGIGAGSGISVDNTNPAVPVVSNTGVLSLTAGSNISLSGTTGNITISASGGGGGGGNVDTVSGGTGITLTGTAQDVIVNNAGVLSLGVGSGLVNTGTAQDPVIAISGTGTITTQQVDATKLVVSGTGADYTTFGAIPRISGVVPTPTEPSQLVPLQYVNSINTGVQSITAGDASIEVGGTPVDPTIAVAASGVVGGTYTNTTLTVGADGRITNAVSGAAPVLSVSAGSGISVGGTASAPIVSNTGVLSATAGTGISLGGSASAPVINNTGVLSVSAADGSITVGGTSSAPTVALPAQTLTAAAYTWPALTVDQKGVITAVAENTAPYTGLTAGSGISISGTKAATTITNDGITSLNTQTGAVSIAAGTNITVDDSVPGTITINSTAPAGVSQVSGVAGQITVSNGTTTPLVGLATLGAGEATYAYPASVSVDDYGRVMSITAGDQTTVNGLGSAITLAAGTNVSLAQLGQTITINATGGGGGIASINGQTGSAITLTGSGYTTVSNPTPDTIQFYSPGTVDQIQAGLGISVNNGDPMYPTITAAVAGLQAGTGITISPLANNVFQIDATGGGSVSITSSTTPGIDVVDNGGGSFSIGNTGVISAAAGDATMTVNNDGLGNLTLFASPGGSIVSDMTGGGSRSMTAMLNVAGTNIRATTNLQTSGGRLGFQATGGTSQTYSLLHADASSPSELGLKRCKLDQSNNTVAGTTGFLYDQYYNQTVAVPFATTAPSFVAPIGTTINNSLTKIVAQAIQPNATAWNFLTARQWGILGNFTLITAAARAMRFTFTFQKNGGTERTMAATYIANNAYMTIPVNNISVGIADGTLSANDTLTINVYAQTIVSLETTTIATAVPLIAAVLSPMSTNS